MFNAVNMFLFFFCPGTRTLANLTFDVCVSTSQISRQLHVPSSELTASFFEFVENRTAPTRATLLNEPATSLPVSKLHIRAV
ncbi:uncharacterized protein EDB91DRAFT_551328 [Suillus paluster]|uniref:uncharacterized protein n=1 Tax=Suillus paluster TaxID=48578 RepID=UPI001B885A41|nr:uncharacterized protein EDB91DRAFT_551328 [Suillus paluster]KAG1735715.1 hypothetical protein EDB91DRAFT_551328 [Suillus paluster]